MRDPSTLPEIRSALAASGDEVVRFFGAIPSTSFFTGDPKHWGPAHHLGHLTIAHARIAAGFRAGATLPPHPTGRSRDFAAMREFYLAGLATAPASFIADNPLTPTIDPALGQPAVVEAFVAADRRLQDAVAAWSEEECDARALRHPVLGAITAREMLFFCLGHDRHHVEGVRRQLDGAG